MPKQIYNESDFSGGINGTDSPRDVPEGQVIQAKSAAFDEKGRIRMMGRAIREALAGNVSTGFDNPGFESGTSFFRFAYDFGMLNGTDESSPGFDTSPDEKATHYFALGNAEHVAIWDSNANYWFSQAVDMKGDAGAGYRNLQFYFLNGALRCYNPTFDTDQVPRWHGHIKRTLFKDSNGEIAVNQWYTTTTKLMAPNDDSAFSDTIGSESPGRTVILDTSSNVALDADTLQICLDDVGTAGTWIGTVVYSFYLSYIYDGSQESPVGPATTMSIADTTTLKIGVTCDHNATPGTDFNTRITGARLYYSDPADGHGIKYHLLDIDFSEGCKKFDEETWTLWNENDGSGNDYECPANLIGATVTATSSTFDFEDMPKTITYEMLNGYGPTEETDIQFKCHTILNNRLYVGNIRHSDGTTHADRVVQTPINFTGVPQYDTFPIKSGILDIAANDGDSVVALEGYGDRILVFKEKNVYVLNVANGGGYVETKFADMGVKNVHQVTATKHGIVWINSSGCYLYQEGQPINLITGKLTTEGRMITPSMKWHVRGDKRPAVCYLPRLDKLLISIGLDDGYSNDAWTFNFAKKSWAFAGGGIGDWEQERSNFAVDSHGDAYFAQNNAGTLEVYKWSDQEQAHTEFGILFKDFDAGQPNIRKKFYKAYIQFRASGTTNVIASYGVNGNYSDKLAFDTSEDGIESGGMLTFSATQGNLVTVNPDFKIQSHDVLTAIGGTPGSGGSAAEWNFGNDAVGWLAFEENDGAKAFVKDGMMTWRNDANSDAIMFQEIAVANTISYTVTFTNNIQAVHIGGIVDMHLTPSTVCYITTSNSATLADTLHSGFISSGNVEAFLVVSSTGQHSFNFTADASAQWYICFRSVILSDGTDPDAFASWGPADTTPMQNIGSVSSVRVKQEDAWSTAVLKPNTPSEANNIKSMALRLDVKSGETIPSDFEIDSISYVYRNKNIK